MAGTLLQQVVAHRVTQHLRLDGDAFECRIGAQGVDKVFQSGLGMGGGILRAAHGGDEIGDILPARPIETQLHTAVAGIRMSAWPAQTGQPLAALLLGLRPGGVETVDENQQVHFAVLGEAGEVGHDCRLKRGWGGRRKRGIFGRGIARLPCPQGVGGIGKVAAGRHAVVEGAGIGLAVGDEIEIVGSGHDRFLSGISGGTLQL